MRNFQGCSENCFRLEFLLLTETWTLNNGFHFSLSTSEKEIGTQFVFTVFWDCISMTYSVNRKILSIQNLFKTRKAVFSNKNICVQVLGFLFFSFNLRRKNSWHSHPDTAQENESITTLQGFLSEGERRGWGAGVGYFLASPLQTNPSHRSDSYWPAESGCSQ